MKIAIIGAGLAGLACARALAASGHQVRLFDKGRAAGGRLATRRLEHDGQTIRFDHGAQYLRVRHAGFGRLLAEQGCQPWPPSEDGEDGPRLVPVPAMSALPRALAQGLDLTTGVHVAALRRQDEGWMLGHVPAAVVKGPIAPPLLQNTGLEPVWEGPFDAVALTAPAPQSAALLAVPAPDLAEALEVVEYAPCWSWMAAFAEPLPLPDTLRPDLGPIGWAARNTSKPGREGPEAWVVQTAPQWSREHLESSPEQVSAALRAVLRAPEPLVQAAHRWRYSLVERALGRPCLWDAGLKLGVAGDFCLAGRAESAFLSGEALAQAIRS